MKNFPLTSMKKKLKKNNNNFEYVLQISAKPFENTCKEKEIYPNMNIRYGSIPDEWLESFLSRKRKRIKKKGENVNIKGKKVKRSKRVKCLKENLINANFTTVDGTNSKNNF